MTSESIELALQTVQKAVEENKLTASAAENLTTWLTGSQYEAYHATILDLIDSAQFDELDKLFWEVIRFGTGGRRGLMAELGSATINERTIAESAHGLAAYYKEFSGKSSGRAVVTSDTRIRSHEFAQLTATTFAAHGFEVFFFESHRATPELSFAVRHLNCDIGAMISASHNPPSDNGFKAYWNSGGQILAPHDRGVIDKVYEATEIPSIDFDEAVANGSIKVVGKEIDEVYLQKVADLSLSSARDAVAVFSPLHGVGETSVWEVLQKTGFTSSEIFEPHRQPDGSFTNVADQLPNPERTEVFAPVNARAAEIKADLVLASDPDADRLGVCVRDSDGNYQPLTGNQVGALLVDYVLSKRAAAGSLSDKHYVVETMVTTPLIGRIAKQYGVQIFDNLLVGFKYIAQTMDQQGPGEFVFGAEESLGYLAGDYCRDKDAAVAALFIMELASELKTEGNTLLDHLDTIYQKHGYHMEGQTSKVCTGSQGKAQIDGLMKTFATEPPTTLAGLPLVQVDDFIQHEVRSLPDNSHHSDLPEPEGDLMFFRSADGPIQLSIAVRPSGTEPKIKFYYFSQSQAASADLLEQIKQQTKKAMEQAQKELMAWVDKAIA